MTCGLQIENSSYGIIKGNILGTDLTNAANLRIEDFGIFMFNANNNTIGGIDLNESNTIAYCNSVGIVIKQGISNQISGNIIYNNPTAIKTPNTIRPEVLQYFSTGHVSGKSKPNNVIEIFGSTGNNNANQYLKTVTADASGNWNTAVMFTNWQYLVATARDGNNNTSELSSALEKTTVSGTNNIFTVTKTTDPDPFLYDKNPNDPSIVGTLQWAIRKANETSGSSTVNFNIQGTVPHIINLRYFLPPLDRHQIIIDGTTAQGYQNGNPAIIIDGYYKIDKCFVMHKYNSKIKGLYIRNFLQEGIYISSVTSGFTIQNNVINQINNYGSTTVTCGIHIEKSSNGIIKGNILGTDVTNETNLGIEDLGIFMVNDVFNNTIGGTGLNEANTIAYNSRTGIQIEKGNFNRISGNSIFNNPTAIKYTGTPNPLINQYLATGSVTGISEPDYVIEIFGSTGKNNANKYLTTVTADASGKWNATLTDTEWQYIAATARDVNNNTSELSSAYEKQNILVEWNFPVNPDNSNVDIYSGTPDNSAMKITCSQQIIYTYNGYSSYSAGALKWNNGSGIKYWQVKLNTTGHKSLRLFSKQRSAGSGPKDFKLQYKISANGTWTDLADAATIIVAENWTDGILSNVLLPAECENRTDVFIRWIMTSNKSVSGGTVATTGLSYIDDIRVTGVLLNDLFYFQSKQNGNFNDPSTWKCSVNNTTWTNASFAPTYKNNNITIQTAHTVIINETVTVDQLIVNGTLIYAGNSETVFNINDGTDADLTINGTFEDNGSNNIKWTNNSAWLMGNQGKLIRTRRTSADNWRDHYFKGISYIPATADWIIRKTGTDNPLLSSTGGMYYPNLSIENYTSTLWTTPIYSSFSGSSDFPRIKGDLNIGDKGTGDVSFLNNNKNATPVLVEGKLIVKKNSALRNFGTGIEIQGNLAVKGKLYYDSDDKRKLVFSGNNNQNISGNGTLNIFELEVNKSSNSLSLDRNITIDNSLVLTSGNLILGTNDLTFSTTATVSNNSNTSYVVTNSTGKIIKLFSALESFTFPTGDANNYTPFSITLNSASFGSNASISARVINSAEPHIGSVEDYINRYWDINSIDLDWINADVSYNYIPDDIIGVEKKLTAICWNFINGIENIGSVDSTLHKATANNINNLGYFSAYDIMCEETLLPLVGCNLVGNGDFSSYTQNSDIFHTHCVPNWYAISGNPAIYFDSSNPTAFLVSGSNVIGSDAIYTNVQVLPNTKYFFTMNIKVDPNNPGTIDHVLVDLTKQPLVNNNNMFPPHPSDVLNLQNITNFSSTNYVTICYTFLTDNSSYVQLYIHPEQNSGYSVPVLLVDNVALYPIDLGIDQTISCGDRTPIGTTCNFPNSFTCSWSTNINTPDDSWLPYYLYSQVQEVAPIQTTIYTLELNYNNDACIVSDNVTVNVNVPNLTITNINNVTCFGGSNGSATASLSGGIQPYYYQWSNGATTETISGLSAGIYIVTATSNSYCKQIASVTITEPTILIASITSQTNEPCYGDNSGTATVTASGGAQAYSYLWSNSATTATIYNLAANVYNVTVTDANGCTAVTSVTITEPAQLQISASTVHDNTCPNNGSIVLTVTGGTFSEMYHFIWSNSATSVSIFNLVGDNYSVTVSDDNGCNVIQSFVVADDIQCCQTTADYSYVNGGNISSLTTYFGTTNVQNKVINIYGTVYINVPVTFDGCTFNMGTNAEIFVNNNINISFNNTTIQSCYDKWNRIYLPNGTTYITATTCTIRDAQTAIDAENGGYPYFIWNTHFLNNDISINIHNYHPGGVLGQFPAGIYSNTFEDNIGIVLADITDRYFQIPTNTFLNNNIGIYGIEVPKIIMLSNSTFTNCGYGIAYYNFSTHGEFDITANTFTNCTYAGVWCVNLQIARFNTNNIFNNCAYGIHYENQANQTSGQLIVNNNNFNNCNTAAVLSNNMRSASVTNSIIENAASDGINFSDCESSFINGNTINTIGNWAILNRSGNSTNILTEMNISGNTITNIRNGISCMNLNFNSIADASVSGNTISLDNYIPPDPSIVRFRGIAIEGCTNINVNGSNSISGQSYWNYSQNGIEVENSSYINLECNLVQNIGRGIWLGGTTPSVYLWGNRITTCLQGLMFNHNSQLSEQGQISEEPGLCGLPSDNQWLGTWDPQYQDHTFANVTLANTYTFNVRNNPPSYNPTINDFNPDPFPPSFALIPTPFNSCAPFYSCGGSKSLAGKSLETDSLQYELERKIARNEIVYIINEEEYNWAGKNYLYNRILSEPEMLQADSVFEIAKDSLENTNIGILYNYYVLNADTTIPDSVKISQLAAINNSISPVNTPEENFKAINALNLKIKESGLNSLDTIEKLTIVSIANQCPYSGGNAVYSARVICNLLGYSDEFENCETTQAFRLSNTTNSLLSNSIYKSETENYFRIYPNPSSGNIHLDYALPDKTDISLELNNCIGETIRSYKFTGGKIISSVHLDLLSGIYYVKVKVDNKLYQTNRLVIIR